MSDHLVALARAAGHANVSLTVFPQPLNDLQLADSIGCWHVVERPDDSEAIVVAACPQGVLDSIRQGWTNDPFYGDHPLAAKAALVLKGHAVFTKPEQDVILAYLLLKSR